MNVFIYTLGCRLNQCESEAIAQAFEERGNLVLKTLEDNNGDKDLKDGATNKDKDVNLVIVNTCTVTSKAEQKARRMIRLFSSKCPVLVTGCYAQMNAHEIENLAPNVVVLPLDRKPELLKLPSFFEVVLGNANAEKQRDSVLELLHKFVKGNTTNQNTTNQNTAKENALDKGIGLSKKHSSEFDYAPSDFTYHCRSYLKVQDGCDNNCGYCRVHIARGPASSLDANIAVQRALEIEKRGYHEIVLTGVNLTMYDHNGKGLGGLLEKLLANLGPNIRFRLSSLEPDNVDDFLLKQLEDPRVQPHFHIPIQSAAPKVMQRINRNYSLEHLKYVVSRLREIKEDPFLACDIITGLPAEGDDEFEQTKAFLQENHFAMMHVFPFSPRPNTALEKAHDRAPESVRDERAKILRQMALEMNEQYLNRQIGRHVEVILEERKNGFWYGLTGNYMKVKTNISVPFTKKGDLVKGIVTSFNTVSCNN